MIPQQPSYCLRFSNLIKHKIDGLLSFVESPNIQTNVGVGANIWFGKTILELFPIKCDLPCGCSQNYRNLREFPNETTKCIHGNYFILYENSDK